MKKNGLRPTSRPPFRAALWTGTRPACDADVLYGVVCHPGDLGGDGFELFPYRLDMSKSSFYVLLHLMCTHLTTSWKLACGGRSSRRHVEFGAPIRELRVLWSTGRPCHPRYCSIDTPLIQLARCQVETFAFVAF